jgi:putative transposase
MRTLNKRKLRWILREVKKSELSIYQIAKQQGVTQRWVRKLTQRYGNLPLYKIEIGIPGRPAKPVPEEEQKMILEIHYKFPMCAVKIEKFLAIKGAKHIPHNRIHRVLLEAGKVKAADKKIRRKQWVRYERRHSNSLWHTDYCEIEGKQVIAYIDDASRYIVGYGIFDSATTDNALFVLDNAISENGTPKQLMTDHGTQFCTGEERQYRFSETLKGKGIDHIMARIKRPQSNGKIERWFGTLKKLYFHFGRDLDKAVACYNGMLHLSIDATPAEVYLAKKRNS